MHHVFRVHAISEAQGARAQAYGAQAVVVSIDPRRVWVADPADTPRPTVATANFGPHGEAYCWWQACDWVLVYSPVDKLEYTHSSSFKT